MMSSILRSQLVVFSGLVLAALDLAACVTVPMAPVHLYRASNVAPYSTYFILNDRSAAASPIDKEIRAELEAALADKTWLEVAPEYAQTVVVVHRATSTKRSLDAFYDGWGDWEWRQSSSGSAPAGTYTPGTVLVDLFDAESKRLVWRGVAPGLVSDRSHDGPKLERYALARITAALPVSGFAMSVNTNSVVTAATTTTPNIVFAQAPAVLVRVDGDPLFKAIGEDLQRVTNTRAFLLRDVTGMYYARISGYWMQSYELRGPWSPTRVVPYGADAALQRAVAAHEVSLVSGSPRASDGPTPSGAPDAAPTVVVATSPTALVVTDGESRFERVQGTSLLRLVNAIVPVFQEPTDNELYVRLLGRWFRAWTTRGPWEPVPDDKLPADLPRILSTF